MSSFLIAQTLGDVPYREAWSLQRAYQRVLTESPTECGGFLLLLTHPHTYTSGRRDASEFLRFDPQDLAREQAQWVQTDRGGLVTYHGPGQLVVYPIVDLARLGISGVKDYIHRLEEIMIRLAALFGVNLIRREGIRGVWVHEQSTVQAPVPAWKKLGAVGVHVQRGLTSHGFAFNVNPDLDRFNRIVPCGLSDSGVTSLADLGIAVPAWENVLAGAIKASAEVFGLELRTSLSVEEAEALALRVKAMSID